MKDEARPTMDLFRASGLLPDEELKQLEVARTLDPNATWANLLGSVLPEGVTRTGAMELAASVDAAPVVSQEVTPEADGRYRALSSLGAGGMGKVDLVNDGHLNRRVARKELYSSHPAVAARFIREAKITAQLEHPGIVPIYELGRSPDGTLYYTMKRVRGQTLREALEACSGLEDRLRLLGPFVSVCQAVGYAHSRGVFHRDIKPDNAMLGAFGETLVLDWGLVKLAREQDRSPDSSASVVHSGDSTPLTMAGSVMGTPLYMSPEQASGRMDEVDARSDVWSLGMVLLELVTGERPYAGLTMERVIERVRAADVPVQGLDGVQAELSAIVSRCLQPDPEDRYLNARELALDVERWRTGGRVSAHTYNTRELVVRLWNRNKSALSTALGLGAVIVMLILVGGATLWSQRSTAIQGWDAARAAQAEAERRGLVAVGRQLEAQGRPSEAVAVLRAAVVLDPGDAALNAELTRVGLADALPRVFSGFDAELAVVAETPGGMRIVGTTSEGIAVGDPDLGMIVARHKPVPRAQIQDLEIASDGRLLLIHFQDDDAVQGLLLELGSGKTLMQTPGQAHLATDGSAIGFLDATGNLVLHRFEGGDRTILDRPPAQTTGFRVGPDGAQVLAWQDSNDSTMSGAADLYDAHTGRRVKTLWDRIWAIQSADFSSDGSHLMVKTHHLGLRVYALEDLSFFTVQSHRTERAMPGADAQRILLMGGDSGLRMADTRTGAELWSLPDIHVKEGTIAEDGWVYVVNDQGVLLSFDPDTGRAAGRTRGLAGGTTGLVALDRERVLAATPLSGLMLWSRSALDQLRVVAAADPGEQGPSTPWMPYYQHGDHFTTAAFSEDSRWLAAATMSGEVHLVDRHAGSRRVLQAGRPNECGCQVGFAGNILTSVASSLCHETNSNGVWGDDGDLTFLRTELESATDQRQHLNAPLTGWMALSPDAETLAVAQNDGCIGLLSINSGKRRPLCPVEGSVRTFSWSPDSSRVAVMIRSGGVQVWTREGELVLSVSHDAISLAVGANGILYAAADDVIVRWRIEDAAHLEDLPSPDVRSIATASDGQLAAGLGSGEVLVFSAEGKVLRQFLAHEMPVDWIHLGTQGRLLTASNDRRIRLWDASTGLLLHQIHTERSIGEPVVSPDGALVWLAEWEDGEDSIGMVWEIPDFNPQQSLDETGMVTNLRLCPDQQTIVAVTPYPAPETVWAPDDLCPGG